MSAPTAVVLAGFEIGLELAVIAVDGAEDGVETDEAARD